MRVPTLRAVQTSVDPAARRIVAIDRGGHDLLLAKDVRPQKFVVYRLWEWVELVVVAAAAGESRLFVAAQAQRIGCSILLLWFHTRELVRR